ncbi:MAG: carboxypeptidase regulatory-like domain-containing protein [Acidobacteria bacterium]|nr:MAG: carboxypeptidase regulatory-like domain-containing protein [Acidobacteriota bacterium]REK01714.1 MAG: carboxypeptidase regulatory-like domain-containing protein [Acidobacteriota bacterium]REK14670.1 MAG: carboxypeptidase regulatory-like domain-containing protein [Acidobacteriota bacterium]REK45385.1 MAG: carboxypeptidase regulatory-like domain-containing protein [Acidobacteriota bacterium]
MKKKFFAVSRSFFTAAVVATVLCFPVIGQDKSGSSKQRTKIGLEDIPMLVSLSSNAKVGESIRFVGTQFKANEIVTIEVQSEDIETGLRASIESDTVYADTKGNFVFEMIMPDYGRFVVTAEGSISKSKATRIVRSDSLTPPAILVAGNPSCEILNSNDAQFPNVTTNSELRLNIADPNGTFPFTNGGGRVILGAAEDPGSSVTVTTVGTSVSWSSTRPISAVIVKGGANANAYAYDPDDISDGGPLTTPAGLGVTRISFCFKGFSKVIVIKQASPPSSFQFDFTTTGIAGSNSFSLTDDSANSDPMVMMVGVAGNATITESLPAPYTLVSIDCTSSTGRSTINSVNPPTADIDLGIEDVVTCTFFNDFLTAVEARVSGRVTDANGRAIAGAMVTAVDGNGNSRTARTNMFGFYEVRELEAGTSLFMEVSHKRYSFPTRFLELNEDEMTVNFQGTSR